MYRGLNWVPDFRWQIFPVQRTEYKQLLPTPNEQMSDLLLRRLRKDLLLDTYLPVYDGIDKAVEEETGKECDKVAREYSNHQLLKLIRRILEKRRKGGPEAVAYA